MTTTILVELTGVTCCNCGIVFGIQAERQRRLRETGDWFYCTNGHQQHYTETEADRLRKQLERARQQADNDRAYAISMYDQNRAERRAHAATKGKLTKAKKRIAAGVCPCCNRTFQNLGRHMAGQHPDYADAS